MWTFFFFKSRKKKLQHSEIKIPKAKFYIPRVKSFFQVGQRKKPPP